MTYTIEVILIIAISLCSGLIAANTVSWFIRPSKSRLRNAAIYIIFCLTMANKSWIGDENPIILFPFFMMCFLICYEGPLHARFVMGLIFFSLIEPICMMLDTGELYYLYKEHSVNQLFFALSKLVIWLLIWLLLRRIIPKKEIYPIPKSFWMLLGALSLAPLFSTLSFSIWQAIYFDYDTYQTIVFRIAYTVLPFSAISAAALLVALVVLSHHERLKQQQKVAELQEVYYQSIKREQIGIRTLRHDLHNHIAAARGLLERGDTDGAYQYLEEISRTPAIAVGKSYCENSIADSVISSKAALMEQEGIKADIEVSLPDDLPFPDVELCALIGNALDNAIEAASQATEKRIIMRARADKGILMLRVDNTLKQAPRLEKGRLVTTKDDSTAHGYGFTVMDEIARSHGGMCEAQYTNNEFNLTISIPLLNSPAQDREKVDKASA